MKTELVLDKNWIHNDDCNEVDILLTPEERRAMFITVRTLTASINGLSVEQRILFEKGIRTGYLAAHIKYLTAPIKSDKVIK